MPLSRRKLDDAGVTALIDAKAEEISDAACWLNDAHRNKLRYFAALAIVEAYQRKRESVWSEYATE